jgi:hypothetical protein
MTPSALSLSPKQVFQIVITGLVTFSTLGYSLLSFKGFGRGLHELWTPSIDLFL